MERKHLEDERLSIVLFLAIWVLYAIIYMTKNCYSAAMADLVNEQVLTKSQTGAINAMFYLFYAIFQIIGGVVVDRFSPGKLVFIGMIGAAICNAVVYFNQNYMVMMVVWCINAVVQFGVWPGVFKIVSTQIAREHRSKGIFYISFASSVGLVFSYLFASIADKWQTNFSIAASSLFIAGIAWFFLYRYLEKHMVVAEPRQRQVKQVEKKEGFLKLFITSGAILIAISYFILSILNLGLKSLTPVMLMESYEHISPSLANALNIILIVVSVLGTFMIRKFVLRRIENEVTCITIIALIAFPFSFITTFVGRFPAVLILINTSLIVALVAGASLTISYICARFGKYGCDGAMSGLFNAIAALGIVVTNYVFTKMAETIGWVNTTWVWVGLVVVAVVFAAVAIPIWRKMIKE